jgi:hypothetical protein
MSSEFRESVRLIFSNVYHLCLGIKGTGQGRQGKAAQGNFLNVFSLSFHNYKIVFKVRIYYPLQT